MKLDNDYLVPEKIRNHSGNLLKRLKKSENLENLKQSLSSPIKSKVLSDIVKTNTKFNNEILTYTTSFDNFEGSVCQSTIEYLKKLTQDKKFPMFYKLLKNVFGHQLEEDNFIKWLAPKLNMQLSKFKESISKLKNRDFQVKLIHVFEIFSQMFLQNSSYFPDD